jgi:hypothetical protein
MGKIKIGELVKQLADKVGTIDQSSQAFIDILSTNVEVEQSIADAILESTLTIKTASQHPEVRNKIRAEVFNGVDKNIENYLNTLELADDKREGILTEKETFKRLKLVENAMKEQLDALKSVQGKAPKNSDAEEALKAQVTKLTNDYKALQDTFNQEKQSLMESHSQSMINYQLSNMLASKKYALPDAMTADMKQQIAMTALQNKMSEMGLVVKNEGGKLQLFTKEGTMALDKQNSQILIDKFVDETLVQNKLIDLSGSNPAQGKQPVATSAPGVIQPNGGISKTSAFEASLTADINAQLGQA